MHMIYNQGKKDSLSDYSSLNLTLVLLKISAPFLSQTLEYPIEQHVICQS